MSNGIPKKRHTKPADPRTGTVVQVRLTIEQRQSAEALAASEGCSLSDLARRGLLGHERSVLAAWREGREAGIREAEAALRRVPTLAIEADGRWLASVDVVPGAMAYGTSPGEAADTAVAIADAAIAERHVTRPADPTRQRSPR